MPRIQTAPALEVRVLRNIVHIDTPDKARLWCRVALITPPEDEPVSCPGMIRGYNEDPRQVKESFTIPYGKGQNVWLETHQRTRRPQLVVGQHIYSVGEDVLCLTPSNQPVLETKNFSDIEKMWDYIAEEIRKSKS